MNQAPTRILTITVDFIDQASTKYQNLVNNNKKENKVGLMNQAPTQEKPNAYIRKIKTAQLIYIIEKVGLINQPPTRILTITAGFIDQTSIKYQNLVNNNKKENKVGLMNQTPTTEITQCGFDESSPNKRTVPSI